MTETQTRANLTGYITDPFVEEPVGCSLTITSRIAGHDELPCPNVAVYDAFVDCAKNHERTQHYCERCHQVAVNNGVDCRVCRENGEPKRSCPVTIIASFPRSNP